MNKRLKFLISITLIFAIFVSSFALPASSFETGVETSTADMLLMNIDTDTEVFSQKPDNMWYAGTLAELMTFLLSYEAIPRPASVSYKVEQSFISSLPYTDGCLDKFVGKTLTAEDLMAIMLLTSGSDAAYALAGLASDGDVKAFVTKMNDRAALLEMKKTGYVSPGYDDTSDQFTTCRDLYTLYLQVDKIDFYHQIMSMDSYTPAGLEGENYTVYPVPSIMNDKSPYYFRYVNDAQFFYTEETNANIVLTTTYRGNTYFFAGLLGLNESEQNVYADARKLTTWAYLNLSDRKMIDAEDAISSVLVNTDWGDYEVELHPANSAVKTLPNDFDESRLSYSFDVPEVAKTPLVNGQSLGSAKLLYDEEEIDNIEVVINSDEGLSMLSDFSRFSSYVYSRLMPNQPVTVNTVLPTEEESAETVSVTEPVTQAATKSAAEAATEG